MKWNFSIYLFVLGESLWCVGWHVFTTVGAVWGANESIAGRVRCCGENTPDHWRRVGWTCKHYCKPNACQTLINTLTNLKSRSNAAEAFPLVKMPGEKASSFHPAYGRKGRGVRVAKCLVMPSTALCSNSPLPIPIVFLLRKGTRVFVFPGVSQSPISGHYQLKCSLLFSPFFSVPLPPFPVAPSPLLYLCLWISWTYF